MFDQERHDEINNGLIEGEDLDTEEELRFTTAERLNQIDEVISAEEEEFLRNNKEFDPDDASDLGNNQEVIIH